jgi:hypothetical protein
MNCRELRPGDIMLQFNAGSVAGRLISFGEWAKGQDHSEIIHAGIMFDSTYLIEALGGGILASDLRVQDRKYGYSVFRPSNTKIAGTAAVCAKRMFDVHGKKHNLSYSTIGAIGSLLGRHGHAIAAGDSEHLISNILSSRSHPFFCSQFVVCVYQYAGARNGMSPASVFRFQDSKVAPSLLASQLESNLMFKKVGTLLPHER